MNGIADLSLNPAARPSLRHLGVEGEPLLQVENLLLHPEALVDYAASEVTFEPVYGPRGGYPGIRSPAPLDYVEAVVRGMDKVVREAFGLGPRVRLDTADCNLSLVTLAPDALLPAQRIPHVDTTYDLQFAFLHYLCRPEQGGTAFYRHRATGFEGLTPERADLYGRVRTREQQDEALQGYITGDTDHFEQIGAVEAEHNRLVVYRSRLLHSGQIPSGAELSDDPRKGRLTANIFVTYRL